MTICTTHFRIRTTTSNLSDHEQTTNTSSPQNNLPTTKQNLNGNVRGELNKMVRYLNKIASQLICQFVQNALQPETNKLWTIMEAGTTQRRTSERMGYCLQRDNSASQHLAKRTHPPATEQNKETPALPTACLSMCTKITKQTTYIAWSLP